MRYPGISKRAVKVAFALCLVATGLAAQDNVAPPLSDDLARMFPAIGRLGQEGFATQGCTATLIAPDLILTAAHCVTPGGTKGRLFATGWRDGTYTRSSPSKQQMRHPLYAPNGTHGPRDDVGLVVLETPIDGVPPIPLAGTPMQEAQASDLALVGYNWKTPDQLSGALDCAVKPYGPGLAYVGCPVLNGNSGAPLLRQTPEGSWQIAGVVSSRLGFGTIAVELPEWLRAQVAAHLER